jgi:hypothetical protein
MRRFASLAFVLAAAASPLAAQTAHPDFSGKWALDPKSLESPMPITSGTMVITQDAKTLKMDQSIDSQMGQQKATLSFNLDGSVSKNSVAAQGMTVDMSSTAAWDGSALVVKTTAEVQGQTLSQTERWTIDPDGKTLRVQRDAAAAGQSMSMKMAFTKM